jgi:thiol-disulfide isomerase/thioredoxin
MPRHPQFSLAMLAVGASLVAPAAWAQSVVGRWDATVSVKGAQVPFRLEIRQDKAGVQATLFDGDKPINRSTRGSFRDGALRFDFDSYAAKLEARYDNGVLRGAYSALPFQAERHKPGPVAKKGPDIAGEWEVPVETAKGEKAWRLIVRQTASETFATILRIDGDTGTLNGRYDGAKFTLSRFAGERPGLLEIRPRGPGKLDLILTDQQGVRQFSAARPAEARKSGLAAPSDPKKFTTVRDSSEVFRFSGRDLNGKTLSESDPRFKGKVVLVNVMGSWCPNCHDEAPFLAQLDAKYRARGLAVVGLDFEGNSQDPADLARLKAFIARYKLNYTVLVAGDRAQVREKLPQAVNLNAWPTTFFVGRDGRVRNVHVGFPSRGSGPYEVKARADISHEIEQLLAEKR